jgi:hypothetical protein
VYRRRNERFAANCIEEADIFGGCSVIMWGAISDTGRTALVQVNGTLMAQGTVMKYSATPCCSHYAE